MKKSFMLIWALGASVVLAAAPGVAYHGWGPTTAGNVDLSGVIKAAHFDPSRGVLVVDAHGQTWTIEVGQRWSSDRAGLKDGDLAPGVAIRVIGAPEPDHESRLVRAQRLYLGDKEHRIHPGGG